MCAAEAVMLYGAEVWAGALRKEVHRERLGRVQRRGALRIAYSYRTVSEPAILVVAGVIPIDLLAQERQYVHQQKPALGPLEAELPEPTPYRLGRNGGKKKQELGGQPG